MLIFLTATHHRASQEAPHILIFIFTAFHTHNYIIIAACIISYAKVDYEHFTETQS